jgi:VWFA-related protein
MMRMTRPVSALAAVAALLAGWVGAPILSAQTPEKPGAGSMPFIAREGVSVTNLDVVVTDSKNERVTGLKRDDFIVIEDGIEQAITNFYPIEQGKILLPPEEAPAPAPAATSAPEPVPTPLPAPKTRIVIFVDNVHIQAFDRNRVLRNVESFVRDSVKGDVEGMIVSFNRTLKVRRKFTNDGRDLSDILKQMEEESSLGANMESERRDLIRAIDDSSNVDAAASRIRQYAQSVENDLTFTFDAMKTTLNQLAGVDGRKIMVHVSGGLPQSPGLELWNYLQKVYPNSTAYSMQQFEFDKTASYVGIVQAANAAGVSMYTIDAAGLTVDSTVSAEQRTTTQRIDTFVERTNLQTMLNLMSDETGGRAIINRNDVSVALKEMEKDFTSYYSLGYASVRSGLDRPHHVEVKLKTKRKGLTVLARRSYVEKGFDTKVREAVTSALFFTRDDNALGASLKVGDPAPDGRGNFIVPLTLRVPFSRLAMLPDGNKVRGRVVFYFIVVDSEGKQSELTTQPVPVIVDAKTFDAEVSRRDFVYDVKLVMIPGGQKLSLAIRDDVTNKVSYLQKAIFISAFAGQPPAK